MNDYQKSLDIMERLFARDYTLALATSNKNIPSVRFVDTFYHDGAFYITTHKTSQKVTEIAANSTVSLCNKLYRFSGQASNIGYPLDEANTAIRAKLIQAFSAWYFAHNNEQDPGMCYLRIQLERGFYYLDGTGYKVDFTNKTAQTFPFDLDIKPIE